MEALGSGERSAQVGTGGVIASPTLHRLLCKARLQLAVQDRTGTPSYLSTPAREPTGAMLRLLRHRDPECRFPGCGPGPT
ncbi:MAG TPA: DUF222 domain-containing protein [Actinomycetota bacterium]|nr:DUF222 domain-containing protein [Actinomycetota bacterium]